MNIYAEATEDFKKKAMNSFAEFTEEIIGNIDSQLLADTEQNEAG